MARTTPQPTSRRRSATTSMQENGRHEHRTAKVVELIGSSSRGLQEAIENAIQDAAQTTRGITGAHVQNVSVKCEGGRVTEWKVDLKVAFGIERTAPP